MDAIDDQYIKNARVAIVISDKKDAIALERAKKHNIQTLFMDPKKFADRLMYDQEMAKKLEVHKVDLVLLAGYMRILSPEFVRRFRGRLMNIHPALLPSFPGLHPQRKALEWGVKVTGCTVHFVTEDVDAGPIILQYPVPVKKCDTEESLVLRILEKEHKIFPKAVKLFAESRLKIVGRRVEIV
ncbi:phosphoribosylglycinamide formyltransferase [Candidatus Bathyarchaeota archaeon RBG_16_48_13]|nr:MAG: phosphoribosylglycinamide formyltransferase [Candidatus Bathyarchaeota archaeon RBG_16_48_13]